MALCTAPFFGSCSIFEYESPEEQALTEGVLVLRVGTIGATRSGSEDDEIELMHSLRVVILDSDGKVEHNFHTDFDEALMEYSRVFNVKPGGKKIWLIANESGVAGLDLGSYGSGDGGFGEYVDDFVFEPDYSKPIPMTSMYELTVGSERVEKEMYVVRVATKFTVNFTNHREDDVKVNSVTIGEVADKNYLMPHVKPDDTLFAGYATWIDWLKKVSDDSNVDPFDPSPDEAGWLTDYDMPADVEHRDFTHDLETPITVTSGRSDAQVSFYVPESKRLKEGETAVSQEQEYRISFGIEGVTGNPGCTLPNLRALFRNTHVVVNVHFNKEGYQVIYAGIVFWGLYDKTSGFVEEEE